MNTKLTAEVETYLADLRRVSASGGATWERSRCGPLTTLLNTVGAPLQPKEVQPFSDKARRIAAILGAIR